MIRLIVGVVIGVGLVVGVLLSPLSGASASENRDTPEEDTSAPLVSSDETGISGAFQQALTQPYELAESDLTDNETAEFYAVLMQEYGLTADNLSATDEAGLVKLLPDIKNIQKAALNAPLQEAGKNIKDPELARFYSDLLKHHNPDNSSGEGK